MKRLKQLSAAAVLTMGAALAPLASAATIDFEDISNFNSSNYVFLANGYHGFNWDGGWADQSWVASAAINSWFSGAESHSGSVFVWSNGGTELSMSGSTFTLNDFWARSGWNNSQEMTVTGYLAGNQVVSSSFMLNDTYQHIVLNFSGVDSVHIVSGGNTLIDDITVNAVPEPETYAMLLAGLGLMGLLSRKRRA
jgi:hypothetical protein